MMMMMMMVLLVVMWLVLLVEGVDMAYGFMFSWFFFARILCHLKICPVVTKHRKVKINIQYCEFSHADLVEHFSKRCRFRAWCLVPLLLPQLTPYHQLGNFANFFSFTRSGAVLLGPSGWTFWRWYFSLLTQYSQCWIMTHKKRLWRKPRKVVAEKRTAMASLLEISNMGLFVLWFQNRWFTGWLQVRRIASSMVISWMRQVL